MASSSIQSQQSDLASYLHQPLAAFKGVGDARLSQLSSRGLDSVWDLLTYKPRRYITFAEPSFIGRAQAQTYALFRVSIDGDLQMHYAGGGRRRYWSCAVSDASGRLTLHWFNQLRGLEQRLTVGATILIYGQLQLRRGGRVMSHPRIWLEGEGEKPDIEAQYTGFNSTSAFWFRKLVDEVLTTLPDGDVWSTTETEKYGIMPMTQAYRTVHQPSMSDLDPRTLLPIEAGRRLRFDSLAGLLFAVMRERSRAKTHGTYSYDPPSSGYTGLIDRLPFDPTPSQQEALNTLLSLRMDSVRINALLHGDVGSGKTLVAALLAAHTVENNAQVAIVAPTEILAKQHVRSFQEMFRGTPVMIAELTGSTTAAARKKALALIKTGKVNIVIGTHAIFEDTVQFAKLGLAVIDEQHRFGVAQREALRAKAPKCDLLVMSATPIPRSMLLTLYGDLQAVAIAKPPQGRLPINTQWLRQNERAQAMQLIDAELAAGRQVYFVYPRVNEDEDDVKSATEAAKKLKKHYGPDNVVLLHGQMKEAQKSKNFDQFRDGTAKILVGTTIIEVGIDVAAASVIVIQHAERFGIAQLHQLRGRVGRGDAQSYCFLISDAEPDSDAEARLQALVSTNDGFALAEKDFELRGPGELFGQRQSGGSGTAWHLARDRITLEEAASLSQSIIETDPDLRKPEHSLFRLWLQRFYTRTDIFEGG